eukprot:1177001-Prorocentrum_minimum.AAC.9
MLGGWFISWAGGGRERLDAVGKGSPSCARLRADARGPHHHLGRALHPGGLRQRRARLPRVGLQVLRARQGGRRGLAPEVTDSGR